MTKFNFILSTILICFIYITGCDIPDKIINEKNQQINLTSNMTICDSNKDKDKELDRNLCAPQEKIIYSFKIIDSNKRVAIITSKEESYLLCRVGTKNNLEVDFPQDITNSWDQFIYSFYYRGGDKENLGLDINHLTFETDLFKYDIYYEYSAINQKIDAGLIITDKKLNLKTDFKAETNSFLGSLWEFRGNSKIKINFM